MIEIIFIMFSIIFSLYFLKILLKNPSKAFWLGYFTFLAIPFSGTNSLIELVRIISLGGFSINIIHVTVCGLFLATIYKKGGILLPKEKLSYIAIFLSLSYIMGMIIGFLKNDSIEVLKDSQKYLLQIMWLFILIDRAKNDLDEKKLLIVTCKALTINFSLVIFMNIFSDYFSWLIIEDNLMIMNEGEADLNPFGSGVMNLAIFPLVLFFAHFFQKDKTKNLFACGIISLIFILFLNQSRTVLFASLAAGAAVILVAVLISKRSLIMRMFIFIVLLVIVVSGGAYFLTLDNKIASRLLATDMLSESDTLLTRIMTIQYYSNLIMDNIFGYGFGRRLPLMNQFGRFPDEGGFYTDCLWLNLGMKGGWFTLLMFGILIFIPIMHKFQEFMHNKDLRDFAYLCAVMAFVFAATVMTGQLMHNYQIMLGGATFLVVLSNKRGTVCK